MISQGVARFATALKSGIARGVSTLGVPPNVLTLSSLIPMTVAAWFLSHGDLTVAGLWIVAGGALDLIDGAVARQTNRTSVFGGVLDSVVDRASDTLVYLGAILHFHRLEEPLYVALSAAAMGGALAVSYARARAENVIPECRVGFTERGERIVLLLLGLFFDRLGQAVTLLAFLSWLTTTQRLIHAYRVISGDERPDQSGTSME